MYKISLLFILIVSLASCVSNKRLIYLQKENQPYEKGVEYTSQKQDYRIKPHDVLNIQVKSTQPEVTDIYNMTLSNANAIVSTPGSFFATGYSVSDSGYIQLPNIGKIKVEGMTLSKVTTAIQQAINQFVNGATVFVKLVSFKISVLGEVRSPGYHYVYNEQATIFEGLALSGDIADLGNRTEIKVIRQTDTGSEIALVDITNPNIIKSKYFYLAPNDVIYVAPLKAKAARGNFQQLGIVFSGITALATIITTMVLIKNQR